MDPAARLARLMDGYLVTQLLHVAASLGIPDALAAGPRTATEVAETVGADPAAVGRVLRGLASEGVITEEDGGRFAATDLSHLLESRPDSQRAPAVIRGDLYFRAAAGLLDAVRRGGSAFEHVYGARFFEHLDAHPDDAAAFQSSMAGRADTYLLCRVLHDWDDADALRVLSACRRAVAGDGRLVVVDIVVPRRAREQPAAVRMDLHMLLLFGGARERTRAEFGELLARAGWRLERVVPTGARDGLSVLEARAH